MSAMTARDLSILPYTLSLASILPSLPALNRGQHGRLQVKLAPTPP